MYPFLKSSLSGGIDREPKDAYIKDFSQRLSEQFKNSSDWFIVEEETSIGSNEYQTIDVRINKVIDTSTGDRVGDDFKKLLFSNPNHSTELGRQYRFDDNVWITVNIDKIKSLTTSVTVKRCNNVLRWIDSMGGYHENPCSLSYLIKENRDYSTAGSALVVPSGATECIVQYNTFTNMIKPNQRFLFGNSGNWIAYRVEGGGINNMNNTKTFDNNSVGFIRLTMVVDYVNNQTDDLTNGIANATGFSYSLSLNHTELTGTVGNQIGLQAVVKSGNEVVNFPVIWESTKPSIATVNENGIVTLVQNGTCDIRCFIENNSSVYATCPVVVSSTPDDVYQIFYSPEQNYILQGETLTLEFILYKNGVAQADTFSFDLDANSVPSSSYDYSVIDGNTVSIYNIQMWMSDGLTLTATTGVHNISVDIYLKGSW